MHTSEIIAGEPHLGQKPPSPAPSIDKSILQSKSVPLTVDALTFGASAVGSFNTAPRPDDPYRYQTGFGNRFASEAIPGALPPGGQSVPQRCPFDLYSEQLNGTSFISSRQTLQNVWLYRIKPSVAHYPLQPMSQNPDIEACFSPHNSNIQYTPLSYCWGPLPLPTDSEKVTFVEGLKTMGGHGDPTHKEGLALHMYTANTSMSKTAFINNDGDFLIIPQVGRLGIQTELGRMIVRVGEVCVIQAGIRFKVSLPDGPARGYIQEIFGTHYELPELGPVGSNGLAHPRDFETPSASFDIDSSEWKIILKLTGKLFSYTQNHTPFDVVAWHGNYAPYKYDLSKFNAIACGMKEQLDPTVYTVLMAKSKIPGVYLSEFAVFTPKWLNTQDTFRPPYYHRNMATEIGGLIYGKYRGSVKDMVPGGLSCENSYMPHGESYEAFKRASTAELGPELSGEGALGFMLHLSSHFSITKFAMERHPDLKPQKPKFWEDVQGHFLDHLDKVNDILVAVGRPKLGANAPIV
ncbi:putative homogentisate 1,2-dioxygenase [Mollisia scopiformis]|uniref:homogentisate 1,2-dioxygenase n=1 Tax=Mollisia scopiformis TaxID=149040 RepID=A0A132BDB2_MOLSC|nr:putative homogentisate 1,2-dioxygenase [Mollisia scopiformis]KUJ10415.1 putative homogentisate 1,2-dioxygenase [Mollisia scopiformis]